MKKEDIRLKYREKRASLSEVSRSKMDDLILIQFQRLPVNIPSTVMSYWPIDKLKEFDPQQIIDYCYFKNPGIRLLFPVMGHGSVEPDLIAVTVSDDTIFKSNKYGIEEPVDGAVVIPAEIDLVIVPLLYFDKTGNRVGYGKGYYDRFLRQCRNDCVKVGFGYFPPEDAVEDVNTFDVKLDYGITPDAVYDFV